MEHAISQNINKFYYRYFFKYLKIVHLKIALAYKITFFII